MPPSSTHAKHPPKKTSAPLTEHERLLAREEWQRQGGYVHEFPWPTPREHQARPPRRADTSVNIVVLLQLTNTARPAAHLRCGADILTDEGRYRSFRLL